MTAIQSHNQLPAAGVTGKRFLPRLKSRIRNGLLVQDIVDVLARAGIVICPYFVAGEPLPDAQSLALPPHMVVKRLGVADAAEITRITLRPSSSAELVKALQLYYCVGLFVEGELAAYTWASTLYVPVPDAGGTPLFPLEPDEAYLFDMYVAPRHRGTRLAALLRQSIQRQLASLGRQRFYSISMVFNRSSRRFKARMGSRELELRLYLQLRWGTLPGIDIRLRRLQDTLRSPGRTRVAATSVTRRD